MILQYQCACCSEEVRSTQKECHKCGSQHIKSPYALWIFCVVACLFTAITFKVGHVYFQTQHEDAPAHVSILDVLQQDSKSTMH